MEPRTTHNKGAGAGDGGCGCCSWILATILYNGLFFIFLMLIPWMESVSQANCDKPTTCSVELAGFQGLQPPAQSPAGAAAGAVVTSSPPTFDLIVHINNGYKVCPTTRHGGGGDNVVVVSYAGVPLAHGRTASCLFGLLGSGNDEDPEEEVAVALPVKATSAGAVGIPGDLFRLMTEEWRWGVAQLQVEVSFASDESGDSPFVCHVQLDVQQRIFNCYKPTGYN